MKIEIVTFGIAGEVIGQRKLPWNCELNESVAKLKTDLILSYPALKDLSSIRLAVNSAYVDDNFILSENDEVAIIPPVSGG